MNLKLPQSAVTSVLTTSIAARVFYGLMVDSPDVHNGAWISVIIGLVIALPLLCLLAALARNKSGARLPAQVLCAIFALALAFDAASVVDCAAFSAGYVVFLHITPLVLAIPLLLAALFAARLGGDAVGYASILLCRLLFALLAAIALLQLPYYKPGWFTPVFGLGAAGIVRGGMRAGGWMTAIAGSILIARTPDDALHVSAVIKGVLASAGVAIALISLRLMLLPALDGDGMQRLYQIDALLTNGRTPLYLQLPLISAWFVAMLNLIGVECAAAAGLLSRCFACIGGGPAAFAAVGLVAVLFITGAPWFTRMSDCGFPLLAASTIAAFIFSRPVRRHSRHEV